MAKKPQLYDLHRSTTAFLMKKIPAGMRGTASPDEIIAKMTGFLWDKAENPNVTKLEERIELTGSIEWSYFRSGTPAIFPESKNLLEKLFHSNYLFNGDFKLSFPFKTFQVAIPRGFEVDGVKIPPFLVRICRFSEMVEEHKAFLKEADINASEDYLIEDMISKDMHIGISISGDKNSHGLNGYFQIKESIISSAVKSRNVKEFAALLNEQHKLDLAEGKADASKDYKYKWGSDDKTAVEFAIVKILAVLSIYLSATENVYLKKGLPGSHMTSIGLVNHIDKPTPHLLKQTETIKKLSNNNSPDEHYRVFHFRNLRAERYYQGEYKDIPIGSRWVFVKDSLVNSKTNGFTPVSIDEEQA